MAKVFPGTKIVMPDTSKGKRKGNKFNRYGRKRLVKYKGAPNASTFPVKTKWGKISQKRYRKSKQIAQKIKARKLSPHAFIQKNKDRKQPLSDGTKIGNVRRHKIKLPSGRKARRASRGEK